MGSHSLVIRRDLTHVLLDDPGLSDEDRLEKVKQEKRDQFTDDCNIPGKT